MIEVDLPENVELACPHCGERFVVRIKLLHQRGEVYCPACARSFDFYRGLGGLERRRVYYAIRNQLESRVFEQYQMDRRDYFEDWGNLVGGGGEQ